VIDFTWIHFKASNKGIGIDHYSQFLSNPQLFAEAGEQGAMEHSAKIDQLLGFSIDKTEELLSRKYAAYNCSNKTLLAYPGGQAWIGLGSQVLQTPYQELYEVLSYLKINPPTHLVDLGAGYGRLAFILKAIFPECRFTGHEFVKERVVEGKRVMRLNGLTQESLEEKDILSDNYQLPEADVYFIYDFGTPYDIQRLLAKFLTIFEKKEFFLIVKGKATRSMIHNKFPLLFRAFGAKHFDNISLYSSFFELS